VFLACVAHPTAGTTQEANGVPDPGTHAVSIALPDGGGGGFAVRKILGSGANFGVTVHFGAGWSWREDGSETHSGDAWVGDLGANAALGVEWFPMRSMSLSGSTGVRLGYAHADNGATSQNSLSLRAFRSELLLNLYF